MTRPGLENAEDAFNLSPAQAGMVFETVANPDAGFYVGLFDAVLAKDVDIELFKAAWADVISRHQSLRSLIVWRNVASPIQVVRKTPPADLWREETVDVTDIDKRLEEMRREPVSFENAPALGLALLHRSDGRLHFAWTCHHALIDDWSVANVLREVSASYAAQANSERAQLLAAPPYRAFVQWRARQNDNAAIEYWRSTLEDFDAPLDLQFSQNRLPEPAPTDGIIEKTLSKSASAKLRDATKETRVTFASAIATALGIVLHRAAETDDVVYGIALTQRSSEISGVENAVGNFVTTCPLRIKLDCAKTVADILRASNKSLADAQQHAHLPLRNIAELSGLSGQGALFDTVLSINQAGSADGAVFADNSLFEKPRHYARAHYGLSVLVTPGDTISFRILYDPARYDRGLAATIADMLVSALTALPDCLDKPALDLPVMPNVNDSRPTLVGAPTPDSPKLVHEMIADRARETPTAPALVTAEETISYNELDRRSALLAAALKENNAGRRCRVALVLDRRPQAIIGMIAALRANCAYTFIDPENPPKRIAEILQDVSASLAITVSEFSAAVADASPSTPVILADSDVSVETDNEDTPSNPEDPAYILYTSGSTGAPKGVIITQANLAYSTAARLSFYKANPKAFLLLSALTFDSSVAGIYWTLCSGGALVLPASGAEKDVAEIARLMSRLEPTHTLALPSLLDVLLEYLPKEKLASLKTIIAAGEALSGDMLPRLKTSAPQARIYNEYGPTEATVWCSVCDVTDLADGLPAPIGHPIPGARLYLRDSRGRPVPDGLPGELFVGGPGVAAGYLNKPTETANSFVDDPEIPGAKLYKTGDRVRVGRNGKLDFLGRVDRQIKLRGRRIEPGEIETALMKQDGVSNAAVKQFGEGSAARLVAFVAVTAETELSAEILRQKLVDILPTWMAPDQFVFMKALPVTRTGKIDRNALKEPDRISDSDESFPETPLEETLSEIWRKSLSLEHQPGVHENFFDLGGNSLTAMRVFNEIEKELGRKLPYSIIGKISTIADQAMRIENSTEQKKEAIVSFPPAAPLATDLFTGLAADECDMLKSYMARWPGRPAADGSMLRILNADGTKAPLIWCFNNSDEFERLASRLGPDQPVIGMRSGNIILDLTPANQRLNNRRLAMTLLPELLKAQPHGPYQIGGNCQGSAVAMELALALQNAGHYVSILFIMEAVPDHAFPGRVALLFGKDSEFHPYKNFEDPEKAWRRRYLDFSVDLIPGRHGTYFRRFNVGGLAAAVKKRLKDAETDAPRQLYDQDCRIVWHDLQIPQRFAPGERKTLSITMKNDGHAVFHPSTTSGVRLANRWLEKDGAVLVMKDGFGDLQSQWRPGETLSLEIKITAPQKSGAYILEFDMVEEGVARFSERGAATLRVGATVGGEHFSDENSVVTTRQKNGGAPLSAMRGAFQRLKNLIQT